MLFNTFTFIFFFVVAVTMSRAIKSWSLNKLFLLLISYLFYASWNPPFVILLWISTIGDWYFAKLIFNTASISRKKVYLFGSLLLNLGMLGYFKYANFVLENFVFLLSSFGISWQPHPLDIILPVGISFYTFQTLSYTIDVYRGNMPPAKSVLDYALYVTFFPQLVAGPIVRAVDFIPQCVKSKRATVDQLSWGVTLFILGLFYKVVIADGLMAGIVETGFSSEGTPGFLNAWGATLSFSTQIFCDFAGYSTCAIGIALCFGFALPDNFRFPYAALGFSDFWRRWHISLSSWLRDYLYISLGGNRRGKLLTYRNLLLTMFLGGLWHGASWNFAIWGLLHGLFLIFERSVYIILPHWRSKTNILFQLFWGGITYICVCFAWVFFRANSLDGAVTIISGMLGCHGMGHINRKIAFIVPISLVIFHWLMRDTTIEDAAVKMPYWLKSIIISIFIFCIILYWGGEDRAFIYFQF